MSRRILWTLPALVLIPLFAVVGSGQQDSPSVKKSSAKPNVAAKVKAQRGKQSATNKASGFTQAEEQAATAFVTKHHDELLELLTHLKAGLPREYEKAVRDLARTSDRLEALARRDSVRFELELKLWQAKSRRQLLTARLQMGLDEALIQQVRETLAEEHRLQLAVFKHERERLGGRLKKLDEQIEKQEQSEQNSIDRQITTLLNELKGRERKVKASKRKAPAPKNTKDPA
jgi:hypothetical protein